MVLKILLIISIVLQLVAAVVAIRLTRVTKYNVAWLLFTVALIVTCFIRFGEYIQVVGRADWRLPPHFFAWMGVFASLCFAIGTFFVGKIFDYIGKLDYQKRLTERRILNTVLRTEEKERMRFSKELHDGLGPLLSSAKMSISELARESRSEEDVELIKNTTYVIEEAIRSLREISNNLSPHMLETFGLARAVNNFTNKAVANTLNKTDIEFTTNLSGERFDSNVEVIVYRVICELINNSLKHSGAKHIRLDIQYSLDMMHINYSDDGKGFDITSAMDVGMGMFNMTSRINSLKGTINIESKKDNGMNAYITVHTNTILNERG